MTLLSASLCGVSLPLLLLGTTCAQNLIPSHYRVANAPDGYDTTYAAEYFDVYSPLLRSRYSEVIWRGFDNIPLPPEIVERFANKTMAIIGYEVDQVRVDENGQEVPVPITHAYNHHYVSWLKYSKMGNIIKRKMTHQEMKDHLGGGHGDEVWLLELFDSVKDKEYTVETQPSQVFSEANGGEMRGSYHGYPKGYAQLIHSPDTFGLVPMQIDVWNRNETSPKFVPGPLPKNSPQRGNPNAAYSGLLECPCSDRLEKVWWEKYKLLTAQDDPQQCVVKGTFANASECFDATAVVFPNAKQMEYHAIQGDTTRFKGCSVEQKSTGILQVYWNQRSADDQVAALEAETPAVVAFVRGAVNATVELETVAGGQATITMVGPADRWFGMGFGSLNMCRHQEADECHGGGPYAILVYDDRIEERHLGLHGEGTVLETTITVVSNTVDDSGNRTVVVTRAMELESEEYFSFSGAERTLDVILARGCNMTLAQHCGHGSATMNFMAVDTPMRVCKDGIDGTIDGGGFRDDRCAASPRSTLLESKNPTCDIRAYTGGLSCCRDGKSLLDKDQEIPWPDQFLEYRLKYRYWFEDYQPATAVAPASHQHLVRFYWMTEAYAGEYDVTACPPGTPSSQCIHVIESRFKVRDMINDHPWSEMWGTGPNSSKADGIKLIYAGPHCHAPSCLSMELYNADTGDLLCHVEPRAGASRDQVYDELGFLAIPPCLWSDHPEDGLMAPRFLSMDTTLLSIKRNNNTVAHFGEMASWQMRGHVIMPGESDQKQRAQNLNSVAKAQGSAEIASDQGMVQRTSVRRGKHEI